MMKECVAQIAAQVCRVLDVPSASGGAWWQEEKHALDFAAEEACALFAMHLSIVLPAVPPAVRPRFLKHCAGQLQALLVDVCSVMFLSVSIH